jgi:hypothetical protein
MERHSRTGLIVFSTVCALVIVFIVLLLRSHEPADTGGPSRPPEEAGPAEPSGEKPRTPVESEPPAGKEGAPARPEEAKAPGAGEKPEKAAPAGKIDTLAYSFKSEEERLKYEMSHLKKWEEKMGADNRKRLEGLRDILGLNPHQVKAIVKLVARDREKREALIAGLIKKTIRQDDMKEAVERIRDETFEKLRRILTPEQYEKYLKLPAIKRLLIGTPR